MNEIIEYEKKYLHYTIRAIELEIKKNLESENDLKKESLKLSFEDRLRGTHLNLNSLLYNVGAQIDRLERARSCPYFGRIDYQESSISEVLPIYIGKSAITHNFDRIVYDWRSPICGLYYDSEVGPVSFNSLLGIQSGELLLKRHILIKNGELINAVDSSVVTIDELLMPYLDVNADNKMKTIIASIQKEQNAIIRSSNNDIIVQGVAGSGKTSVALHRIAYLIYSLGDKAKSNDFLVIGPNNYFLNYISSILPDLETTPVEQKTLLDLMNEYLGIELSLSENTLSNNKLKHQMQKNISSFKGSLEYRDLLDKFIDKCLDGEEFIPDDFKIDGKVVFSAYMIRSMLTKQDGKYFNFDAVYKKFKQTFKDKKDDIHFKLNEEYKQIYTTLAMEDPIRKEYVNKSMNLRKAVYDQGEKLLDKYFKAINKSCLTLYVSFINDLNADNTSLTKEEIELLQKDTLQAIRKKQIPFEDISALIYLNYMLTNKKFKYKNIVIDEAQDYSMFAYYALKKIFSSAKFNIYGDIAQNIYPYRGITSWEELNKNVFDDKCDILNLSKSYRTTIEITQSANNVLNLLNLYTADPVIRHGANVEYIDSNNNEDLKIYKINEWIAAGYKTIAIICKDEIEAQKIQDELIHKGINSRYISNKDNKYTGCVSVLTVASAKGLEFDCTIINDASSNIYDANNEVDMHLLYVASTRALHEQVIMYSKEITKPYQNEIKKNKVIAKIR